MFCLMKQSPVSICYVMKSSLGSSREIPSKVGKPERTFIFFSLKGVNVKRDRRNLNHSKTLIINSLQITLQCQWHSSRREIARLG